MGSNAQMRVQIFGSGAGVPVGLGAVDVLEEVVHSGDARAMVASVRTTAARIFTREMSLL